MLKRVNSNYSWRIIAKNYEHLRPDVFKLLEEENLKDTETELFKGREYMESCMSLFSIPTQPYKVRIATLLSWMKTSDVDFDCQVNEHDSRKAYKVVIGKQIFQMRTEKKHFLDKINPKSTLLFEPRVISETDMNTMLVIKKRNVFSANFWVNPNRDNTNIEDLSSKEYQELPKKDFIGVLNKTIIWDPHNFTIEKLEKEEKK
jgi:hypothetical protein